MSPARAGLIAGTLIGAISLVASVVALAAPGDPVIARDDDDVANTLDLAATTLSQSESGRMRATVTSWEGWTREDLVGESGPPGSVCVKVWTTRAPGSEQPNYLVCASPAATGDRLVGTVLRDPGRGLPVRVGAASVSGPTDRVLVLGWPARLIRARGGSFRFAIEAAQAKGCPRPRGCIDTAPDAPASRRFVVAATR